MATAVKKRSKGKKRSEKEKANEEGIDLGAPPDISDLTLENLGQPSNLELVTDEVVTESLTDNPTHKQLDCEEKTGVIPDDTSHLAHNQCDEEIVDTKDNVTAEGDICPDVVQLDPEQEIYEIAPLIDEGAAVPGIPTVQEDSTLGTLEGTVSQVADVCQMELKEDVKSVPDVEIKMNEDALKIVDEVLENPTIQEDSKDNVTSEGALYPDISQMEVKEEAIANTSSVEVTAEVLEDPTIQEDSKDNVTSEGALYPDISQLEVKEEAIANTSSVEVTAEVLEDPTIQEDSKDNVTSEGALYPDISKMEVKEEAIANTSFVEVTAEVLEDSTIQEESKDNVTSEGALYPDISKMEVKEEAIASAPVIKEDTDVLENPTFQDETKDNDTSETIYPDISKVESDEEVIPTAPIVEEAPAALSRCPSLIKDDDDFINICIPLSQAESLFCGKEIEQIKQMSRREEEVVEKSLFNSTEHPLLELLSTFKSSIIALRRERAHFSHKSVEEGLYRDSLWRVEKMSKTVSGTCPCGLRVTATVNYEHATLKLNRLPIGIMRTKGLFHDIQESFSHYQHAVLLAHRQIEGVIQELTLKSNSQIRVILNYLFHSLRDTEGSMTLYAESLKRWASALIPHMLKYGHQSDLLYVWHHLFRQNHSVSWAADIMDIRVGDFCELARAIALLDLLFESAYIQLDLAAECVEEGDDVWEEVDQTGAESAVAPGVLRESDILALLRSFPLKHIVARLVLIRDQKIEGVMEDEWGDKTGGTAVMKSIFGTRVLLSVLQKGLDAHPYYTQLAQAIVELAIQSVCALADLHTYVRGSYAPHLVHQINGELEAVFTALWIMTTSTKLYVEEMPFCILTPRITRSCYFALASTLHAETSKYVQGAINIEVPFDLGCNFKLLIITQIAIQSDDRFLVCTILQYLMKVSFTRQVTPCLLNCQETARKSLRPLLEKHHYLFSDAITTFSMFVFDDFVESADIEFLSLGTWRPSPADVMHVLVTLRETNMALVPVLLDTLDYTPNIGLWHDTQLAIGMFLCLRVVESKLPPPEWYWSVLRKLHLHMLEWDCDTDIDVTPFEEPKHLFVKMYTLLTTVWGHSLPFICENGVQVLLELARAGRTRETVYCLSYVMRVMAQSPESVGLTPKFSEVCNALMTSTPTLMQRAFGRGGNCGSLLLTKLIIAQLYKNRRFEDDIMQLLSAWIHMCREHPTLVETALVCCHDYVELNHHMEDLLEDDSLFSTLTPTPSSTPTLYLYMLRVEHSKKELRTGLWQKLICELEVDRNAGNKPNVDRALNRCDASFTSDALVIHKMAAAALTAPRTHPAHIKLWDWFFCLYMQKPINNPHGLPMGPIFFSGLFKSRVVVQLKKHLQDVAAYHWTELKKLDGEVFKEEVDVPKEGEDLERISVEPSLTEQEDDFLPPLRLSDLVGGPASEQSKETVERSAISDYTPPPSPPITMHEMDANYLKSYHLNAHRLFRSYLKCLEANEGSVTHNVVFEREQAMLIWGNYLESITPSSTEDDKYVIRVPLTCDTVLSSPATSLNPLDRLKERLANYCVEERPSPNVIQPEPTLRMIPANNTSLVLMIAQLLQYLVQLSNDWDNKIKDMETLNNDLWKLVRTLHVPRELSPVLRSCSNNCKPITLEISQTEWCLSEKAKRDIQKNRVKAVNIMRKLAQPRSKAAEIIAALHRATGLVTDAAVASDVLRRAWRCATEAVNLCPPARNALITVVTDLTQEFICNDGIRAAEFISHWSRAELGDLRLELLKTLVDPQKLLPVHVPIVYRALLRVSLPADERFSFLSKFDLVAWEKVTSAPEKRDMLEVITQFISRYGIEPARPNIVLYELLCVHMCAVIDSDNLCGHLKTCTQYSVAVKFPRTAWTHINNVLQTKIFTMPYKSVLIVMPELTEIWMRSSLLLNQKPELQEAYGSYAKENIELLHKLTILAIKCYNNDIETLPVEQFMNDLLSNSLIPSILPWFTGDEKRVSNPIVTQEALVNYATEMVVKILREICDLVSEATSCVLRNAFSWVAYLCPNMDAWPRSSLLLHMQSLPWAEPYFSGPYLIYAIMLCCLDEDTKAFIRKAIEFVPFDAYLAGVEPGHMQHFLGIWLMGFTEDCIAAEFLHVAEQFPWYEMSPQTIELYLHRYFNNREDPGLQDVRNMYKKTLKDHWLERPHHREVTRSLIHLRPGFKVLKAVSRIHINNPDVGVRKKRAAFMKHWVRTITHINTDAEYKASVKALLETVTDIFQMSRDYEEIFGILKHVVTVLNVETDTSPCGIPVWCEWIASAPLQVVKALVRTLTTVLNFNNQADVGDAALKAFLRIEGNEWKHIHEYWKASMWRDEVALVRRGALLAAYGHSSHPTVVHTLGDTVTALSTSTINIVQNEPAVALWMCHMTRRVYKSNKEGAPACREQDEVIRASVALLQSWAEERRLNLLRTFTRYVDIEAPTPYLRLIARLALCILSPSEATVKIYENSHASIIRSTSALADTKHFAKDAKLVSLPKLAKRFYPSYEGYFALEYDLMSQM